MGQGKGQSRLKGSAGRGKGGFGPSAGSWAGRPEGLTEAIGSSSILVFQVSMGRRDKMGQGTKFQQVTWFAVLILIFLRSWFMHICPSHDCKSGGYWYIIKKRRIMAGCVNTLSRTEKHWCFLILRRLLADFALAPNHPALQTSEQALFGPNKWILTWTNKAASFTTRLTECPKL